MYLNRIKLDMTNRETMQALTSPNRLHGAIESCFPGERIRKLWRIDTLGGQAYLMLLSQSTPELDTVCRQFAPPGEGWESRPYDALLNRIEPYGVWRFRLTANPTKSLHNDNGRGRVCAHITVVHQKEWLMERSERGGFLLKEDEFDVVHSQWLRFRKGTEGGRPVTLLSVTYEGILTVSDAESFKRTLTQGIGRGRAYGMGMMTVIKGMSP